VGITFSRIFFRGPRSIARVGDNRQDSSFQKRDPWLCCTYFVLHVFCSAYMRADKRSSQRVKGKDHEFLVSFCVVVSRGQDPAFPSVCSGESGYCTLACSEVRFRLRRRWWRDATWEAHGPLLSLGRVDWVGTWELLGWALGAFWTWSYTTGGPGKATRGEQREMIRRPWGLLSVRRKDLLGVELGVICVHAAIMCYRG
jgi:hypothetical protein